MKILLLGCGGREHALAWKMERSSLEPQVFVWPSPQGWGTSFSDSTSLDVVIQEAAEQGISLVIVGPEHFLADGAVDRCRERGLRVIGPTRSAARIETSKAFAKDLMLQAGIPTAHFELCDQPHRLKDEVKKFFEKHGSVVLKASGLAAGKGVFVCDTRADCQAAIRVFENSLQAAAATVVLEEKMHGRESSYFVYVDPLGRMTRLGMAADYKRLLNNHQGPNTGGMGAYVPVPWLGDGDADVVDQRVVVPLLKAMEARGYPYTGFLYVGLMWSENGPRVVEFNARLGDPETQALVMSDERDWLKMFCDLEMPAPSLLPSVCVVMTARQYAREDAEAASPFDLKEVLEWETPQARIFCAGLKESTLTGTGRVLNVVGRGRSIDEARAGAYQLVEQIHECWTSAHFRTDIAQDALA